MTDLEKLRIERECLNLMTAYCTHLDAGDIDAFLALFTEDLVWTQLHPPGLEHRGQASMRRYFEQRPVDRRIYHLVLNPRILVVDPERAEGVCTLLVIDGPAGAAPVALGGISLLGEYRDIYVRRSEGWRIARRELSRLLDRKLALT